MLENKVPASPRALKVAAIIGGVILGSFSYHFFLAHREAQNPETLRRTMGQAAQKSCFESSAGSRLSGSQRTSYCQCFAEKFMRSYNDQEIVVRSKAGENLTDDDRQRANTAAQTCLAHPQAPNLFPKFESPREPSN